MRERMRSRAKDGMKGAKGEWIQASKQERKMY